MHSKENNNIALLYIVLSPCIEINFRNENQPNAQLFTIHCVFIHYFPPTCFSELPSSGRIHHFLI
jgi:hypothetical protein